jgi:uncharacterized SAM-binding protein YcdF (DUF218 family)
VGRRYLVSLGLPGSAVRAETRSRDTVQNLEFSRALLAPGPVRLVTDEAHAPRAVAIARAVGLEADAVGVPLRHTPSFWRYALREAIATAGYALTGVPEP